MNYSDYSMFCEAQVVSVLDETQRVARIKIKEHLDSLAGFTVRSVDEACDVMYSVDQYAFLTVLHEFETAYHNIFTFVCSLGKKIGFEPFDCSFDHVLTRCYILSSDRLDLEFRSAVTDLLDLLP